MAGSGTGKGKGDLDTVVLRHCSGATAEIYLWGATLCSYKTPDGIERIFVSPGAIFDGKKAIRGGVPLVFPQFGQPDKAMPQHGVARINTWDMIYLNDTKEESKAVFALKDSPATRAMWDHAFSLEYTVSLTPVSLVMTLKAVNTGDAPFEFSFLLHTYLQIPDISKASVCGLSGRQYVDKVAGGETKDEEDPEIVFPSYTDRVYLGSAPGNKDVVVKSGGKGCCAVINMAKLAGQRKPCDVVIWNPYEEASPGDLPPPAFKEFVCVEPGLVGALHGLGAGEAAELTQKIIPV